MARPPDYPRWTKLDIVAELNRRAGAVKSIQARGKLKYRAAGASSAEDCDMNVVLQKPGLLRLQGTHFGISGPVVDMGADGSRCWLWLHLPPRGIDEVHIANLSNLEKLPGKGFLTPHTLLVGLGLEELPVEAEDRCMVCTGFPRRYLLDQLVMRAGKLVKKSTFWVERKDLTISRYQLFDRQGYVQLEIKLEGYKQVEEVPIPHEITMSWPEDGTLFGLKLDHVKLNLPVKQKAWHFEIPEGVEVIHEDL